MPNTGRPNQEMVFFAFSVNYYCNGHIFWVKHQTIFSLKDALQWEYSLMTERNGEKAGLCGETPEGKHTSESLTISSLKQCQHSLPALTPISRLGRPCYTKRFPRYPLKLPFCHSNRNIILFKIFIPTLFAWNDPVTIDEGL